ncbi:MAG: cellulase family glycosylhydrolase [Ruminococcus sp.]|nr:cellulase family glycosylhydrolase [Ruminococcus sp.]
MNKKIMAFAAAFTILASCAGCSGKKDSSSDAPAPTVQTENTTNPSDTNDTATTAEPTTEEVTEHISPVESLSSTLGSQVTVDKIIQRTEGSNTVQLPLADFIEEGDVVSSFTFVIYSADGSDIGEFKGGCGISVTSECPSATDEGWYQSADFSAATQGTYGEIKWDVPADVSQYISAGGDVLFGYWWGNAESIRIDSVICTYTRTKEIPVDGTVSQNVGKSCSYEENSNTINIPTADFLPEGAVPEAVTYNISTSGSFGKFTGAFGYNSSSSYYQSGDISVFTDSSSLSLTWFVPAQAKNYVSDDGELVLGYWWSEQPNVTLDSVTVKYSLGGGNASMTTDNNVSKPDAPTASTGDFRSADEIVKEIKVGWNLGNTLDSYNTSKTGIATETGWGNPKTTKEMIQSVKNAGFNAVRIPITWGEHMNGDTIDSEWLERAAEIVDYAYNEGMFVIINMHHDDALWFEPDDSEYSADSAKLKAIWEQIAARFADYGDRLLFEGMNEPRTIGSKDEWMGGTAAERAVINKYEQDFVDTVRKSGGNNAERSLIITSYAASAETSAINDVVVPNAGNIIISIHYYAPWQFSDGTSTVFDDAGKSELDAKFAELKKKFADKGTPVIIGEFGCVNAAPENVRTDYYNYYIKSAMSQGIKCFVWDNGISTGEQSFGIFNRNSQSWNEAILQAIMDGTK